jgi:hypothetical protein
LKNPIAFEELTPFGPVSYVTISRKAEGYLCAEQQFGTLYIFPHHVIDAAIATHNALASQSQALSDAPATLTAVEGLSAIAGPTLLDEFALSIAQGIVARKGVPYGADARQAAATEVWQFASDVVAARPLH